MSNTTFGREPVEVIEIITPKCVNTHGTSPCTATQTGDAKCFNTRSTCNDAENYQARPQSGLDADLLAEDGDTIASGDLPRDGTLVVQASVLFKSGTTGTIWEQGSSTLGAYLGVSGTDLVFTTNGGDAPRIATPVAAFAGMSVTLYGVIDQAANEFAFYWFDPIEYVLTQIGATQTLGASPVTWADTDDGMIGDDSGDVGAGEDGGPFTGTIYGVSFFDTISGIDTSADAYRQRFFFDDGRKARPSDDIYILPMLQGVGAVGTKLNLTGADDRYEPIGRRAYLEASFADAPHSDYPFDPYLTDRTYDPLERSTFWIKWLRRQKFGKTRALVRRYVGYQGEALADMTKTTYVLDRMSFARGGVSLKARDVLSLTEFRKTQVPAASPGKLNAAMDSSQTTFELTGDQTFDYPASGTVRINDELLTYTGRSYNGGADKTEFTGITRGTDGSTPDSHDVDEGVQLCRRYTLAGIDEILEDFFISDSQVPAAFVDLEKIQTEVGNTLDAYLLTTVISEPTGVDQLVGELAEQCGFYLWWNERRQIVDFQAIRPLQAVDAALTQSKHIIGDSFAIEERPKERINTISIYFAPRDFAGDLDKPVNFKRQLIVANSTAGGVDQYGHLLQTREIFSRWLPTEALANSTGSRYSLRYVDVPFYVTFMLDAKDRELWVGDFVSIEHDYLVDARGNPEIRRWLVVEAEEAEPGHSQRLTCVDVTLDGKIFVISENGLPDFTAEAFANGVAFITNNDGTNTDGSAGAVIG